MPDRVFITGQSEVAQRIANALGLEGLFVRSLKLIINADEPIKAEAVIYATEDQVETLGLEIEKFAGFGRSKARIEFLYDKESE